MRRTTQRHRSAAAFAALSLLAIALWLPAEARAQWTTPDAGNNINNTNSGNVGVGTAAPATIFQIRPAANVNMGFTHTNGAEALLTAFNDANNAAVPLIIRGASVRFQDGTLAERFRVSSGVAIGSGFVGSAPPADGAIIQGNLGLGTTTPGMLNGFNLSAYTPIHIQGTNARFVVVDSATSSSGLALNDSSQPVGGRLWTMTQGAGTGKLSFSATTDDGVPSYKMVLDRAGNLGVGTTAPSYRLEVSGSAARNTLGLTGDGDAVGHVGIRLNVLTTTNIPNNRTSSFVLGTRKDTWYGGDGSGPSFIIETGTKGGGFAAPFLITPTNDIILNSGRGAGGPAGYVPSYGNVGIGTHTPAHKLDVNGNVNAAGLCLGGTCKSTWAEISGAGTNPWAASGSDISFGTGNVGIGTTTPSQKLSVVGTGAFYNSAPVQPSGVRGLFMGNFSTYGSSIWSYNYVAGTGDPLYVAAQDISLSTYVGGNGVTRLHVNNAGNVGVGTSAPSTRLHVGARIVDDANRTYDPHALMVVNQVPTSSTALNDPRAVLYLGRQGTSSQAYGALATFSLSRYEHGGVSAVGSRTRLDIGLTHDSFNDSGVMTLLSNGNVGVGKTNPAQRLDVNGNVNAAGLCLGGTCKTTWAEIVEGASGPWTTSGSNVYYNAGNLGLGTAAPAYLLDAQRADAADLVVRLWNTSTASGTSTFRIANSSNAGGRLQFTDSSTFVSTISADRVGGLRFRTGNAATEATLADRMTILPGGNVGVGTTAPAQRLHVYGGNVFHQFGSVSGQEWGFYTAISNNHFSSNLYFDGAWKMLAAGKGATISTAPNYGNALTVLADNTPRAANAATAFTELMVVKMDGKVGIGKTNPTEALDVQGNITASGNIAAKFQDVAEWVPTTQKLSAGTVVVLDADRSNHVVASAAAYDTKVAGVISEMPGLILGEAGRDKVMVATTGRVKVRVDASKGAIKVGDLLVTSDVTGVAMKSEPIVIGGRQLHAPGTIVGKALEPLAKGVGEILVLLSLQ